VLKKSFKLKIIIPTIAIFVLLVIIINVFLSVRFSEISTELIGDKLIANANSLSQYLDNSITNTRAAAVSMARYPRVTRAFEERDRESLLEIFTLAQDLYGVNYFTLSDADGIVLVRTHDPDYYDDSVINQQNIRDAMDGRVSSYFESGTVVQVSIRTGAPVYSADGTLIGIISAGIRFDTDDTVRSLKELLNSDVTIFFNDVRIATTIYRNGHSLVGTRMDPHVASIVIGERKEFSGEVNVFGERYVSFYKPLFNAHGEAFATFFIGTPVEDMIDRSNQYIRDGIILGLLGLAISIILLYSIISAISNPISVLSQNMTDIANGNLTVEINVKGEDEIGVLGKSLQKIAFILHKLLEDIKEMISEHEKGNVSYSLNAEEFNGGYRTLVNDILALSTISTTDKLTDIPNRRSFDNRLVLEWNRAMRDKTPLSLFLMDLDRFKIYNDSFGHQQGDLALQTVAATITNLLRRSTDFAARWGGEEFVVLLPVTDSEHATHIAETVRAGIETTIIPCVKDGADKVTVSIGVNTLIPTKDCTIDSFLAAADSALYKAKEAGRNAVITAT